MARGPDGPLITPEAVLITPIPLVSTGTDANVQVRGVSPNVFDIRKNIKIVQGRMFNSGLAEVVVGKNANGAYKGLKVGNTMTMGSVRWNVVGVFDAGGSAFDSEVWCGRPSVEWGVQAACGHVFSLLPCTSLRRTRFSSLRIM